MNIIVGLFGLAASLYVTRNHMPTAFTGFFHPAAFVLLLGAPPSILLVGHDLRSIWDALRVLAEAIGYRPRAAQTGPADRAGYSIPNERFVLGTIV